ncbi:MAG: EFR1 family ferrodoxin [Thermodesulfobacteriota bacterium]
MESRRSFLVKGAVMCAGLSLDLTACSYLTEQRAMTSLSTTDPRKALVLWYSQTGNTERYGKLIARRLEIAGLSVKSAEIRHMDPASVISHDLIVLGSPVHYYDIPPNVKRWLERIPPVRGCATAAYVSFGGPEGNQHNAACSLLELLRTKGGVPVGLDAFMNMGTMPVPGWQGPGIQEHRHLPDEHTYARVRLFTKTVLERVREGSPISFSRMLTLREGLTALPLVGLTKWYLTRHHIDAEKCAHCGLCESRCPANAINVSKGTIDRGACIACFACINNCPTGAVYMEMGGKALQGFKRFREENGISVTEPEELSAI